MPQAKIRKEFTASFQMIYVKGMDFFMLKYVEDF